MPNLDANEPIRIPTGVETVEQPAVAPVFVITSSSSPTKSHMSTNNLNPLAPRLQQFPVTSSKKQKIATKHAVLPAIGSTYNHMQQGTIDMPGTESSNQPSASVPTSRSAIQNTTQIVFETPEIHVQPDINDMKPMTPSYNFGNIPTLVQSNEGSQQYSQLTPTITTEPPDDHHSASCQGCGQHLPTIKHEPVMSEEHSHVQQWLVNPNNPYNITPSPQIITTPSAPVNQVIPHNTPMPHRHLHKRRVDIPIRYMEAPQHQVTNKSGKLLTPEDALKRTLKSKKIPPLTKRNSLRSIFSDASSNLEKIAEELDEEAKNNTNSGEEKPDGNEAEDSVQVGEQVFL